MVRLPPALQINVASATPHDATSRLSLGFLWVSGKYFSVQIGFGWPVARIYWAYGTFKYRGKGMKLPYATIWIWFDNFQHFVLIQALYLFRRKVIVWVVARRICSISCTDIRPAWFLPAQWQEILIQVGTFVQNQLQCNTHSDFNIYTLLASQQSTSSAR